MEDLKITHTELLRLRAQLRYERRKSGCPRRALKINVIIALAKGWTIADVADAFELDVETIKSYQGKYQSGKLKGLLNNAYVCAKGFLTDEQQLKLKEELKNNLYQTTGSVQKYVKIQFGVFYSRSGMTKLLHFLGFSYKKPKKAVFKTNPAEQEAFIKSVIEPLISDPKYKNFFLDAAHPTIRTDNRYGWFERGKETVLSAQGAKSRLNILGSVLPNGEKIVVDYPKEVNAESIVRHILKIVKNYEPTQKINIFLDNAQAHIKASKESRLIKYRNLEIIFLPSYSPNLNLAERLWYIIRKQVINNHYFESVKDLKKGIHSRLCRWRTFPKEIQDIFNPKFHVYNRANIITT